MLFPKYRSISENDTHWGKLLIFGELNLDLYQYLYAQPDRKLTFLFKYPWISPVYIIIQRRDNHRPSLEISKTMCTHTEEK